MLALPALPTPLIIRKTKRTVRAPPPASRTRRRYPIMRPPAMLTSPADRHTSRFYQTPPHVRTPTPNDQHCSHRRASRPRGLSTSQIQRLRTAKSALQIRRLPYRPTFAHPMPRMVNCRRMLPHASAVTPRSTALAAHTEPRRSTIKPPDRCPHCNSKRLIKKGTRKKKLEDVPLYRCRACGRTFAPGPRAIRNKTYPLPEILEAFTLYDRGNTLEATAEKISSRTAIVSRPRLFPVGSPSIPRSRPTAAFVIVAGGSSPRRN